jgi:hypothetical protein
MGLSEFDPAAREQVLWNAGRKVEAKRAFKPRQIWVIRLFLDQHGRGRERALFDLAHREQASRMRSGEDQDWRYLLRSENPSTGQVVQQKTGRPVQFELMDDARTSRSLSQPNEILIAFRWLVKNKVIRPRGTRLRSQARR